MLVHSPAFIDSYEAPNIMERAEDGCHQDFISFFEKEKTLSRPEQCFRMDINKSELKKKNNKKGYLI